MCSTYCVFMFLCLLYAPIHQSKLQVGVNLLGNKYNPDSDSDIMVVMYVHYWVMASVSKFLDRCGFCAILKNCYSEKYSVHHS